MFLLFLWNSIQDPTLPFVVISPYSLTFITLTFLKIQISYFAICASVWVCLVFSQYWIEVMQLWQGYCRNGEFFCSQCIISWSSWCQHVSLLVELTFVTWLRRFLLGFFAWQLLSFLLLLTDILGEISWGCINPDSLQTCAHWF